MTKGRAEAFSDGVFAVAATLLVFSIPVPNVESGLASSLLAEWPSYAAYAVSFLTILVIWVNHHAFFEAMTSFDRTFGFLNGFLLLVIAVIPFPTSLLAHYLQAGHDEQAAGVAYGLTMSAMGVAFGVMGIYARRRKLLRGAFNDVAFSAGQFAYPAGTVVAFFSARAAVVIFAATAIFYVVLPLVREAQQRGASRS
jgi:TMEM175 potassium channel family protein